MHLETEATARVEELDHKKRLIRLPAYQRILVPQAPPSVIALVPVRGDATLDELAVRSLDVSKEAVRTAKQHARLDVARRREQSPHAPLQTIVERCRVDRIRERVNGRVVRVLGRGAVEVDLHDARARRVGEGRAEMVDERLELRHTAGSRERQRCEELARRERLQRRDRGAVRGDGLAARPHDLSHARADRVLDSGRIRGALVAQERDIAVEIAYRRRARPASRTGRERIPLVGDPAQAVSRAGAGEGHRRDAHQVRVRDVHDGRCLRTGSTMTVDQRRAHRPQQALAPDDVAIAGVGRLRPPDAEKRDSRDGAPSAEGIFDGGLAKDQVGIAGVQGERGRSWTRRRRVLRQPGDELADGPIKLEPDIHLARLRRMRAARAALLDAKRCGTPGKRVQTAARDEYLEHTQHEHVAGGRRLDRRLDGSQRGHERGEIARRVQGRRRFAEGLRLGVGPEPLDELPVRQAPLLEALARSLVVLGRGLDEEGVPFAGADAAAEGLLRGGGRVALPQEGFDDHGTAAGRAGRSVELAHRDAMRHPDEGAFSDAIEPGKDLVSRGRERDRASGPLAERFAGLRDAAPICALGRIGRGPRMRKRIEDDAAPGRIRIRVQIRER